MSDAILSTLSASLGLGLSSVGVSKELISFPNLFISKSNCSFLFISFSKIGGVSGIKSMGGSNSSIKSFFELIGFSLLRLCLLTISCISKRLLFNPKFRDKFFGS